MREPAPGFDEAWRRFLAATSLRLVPQTPESEPTGGRDRYLAFLIPVSDEALRSYIRPFVEAVAPLPGIEPYPPAYWHITVKGAGFEVAAPAAGDEVSPRQAEAIAEAAARLLAEERRFPARLGRLNAFEEVVFVEVWDGGEITRLNTRFVEEIAGVPRFPVDGPVFLPHVSIARFTSAESLGELKRRIGGLRERPAGPEFTVASIDFVRAHLSAAAPGFELLRRFPLR